jgi:hypothetical protein
MGILAEEEVLFLGLRNARRNEFTKVQAIGWASAGC